MKLNRIGVISNSETGRSASLLADHEVGEWVLRLSQNFGRFPLPDRRFESLIEAHGVRAAFMKGI